LALPDNPSLHSLEIAALKAALWLDIRRPTPGSSWKYRVLLWLETENGVFWPKASEDTSPANREWERYQTSLAPAKLWVTDVFREMAGAFAKSLKGWTAQVAEQWLVSAFAEKYQVADLEREAQQNPDNLAPEVRALLRRITEKALTPEEIPGLLKTAGFQERLGYFLLKRFQDNRPLLAGLIDDEFLPMPYRLYALSLALPHLNNDAAGREQFRQWRERLNQSSASFDAVNDFLKIRSDQGSLVQSLAFSTWMRDEELKVYLTAVWLRIFKQFPFLQGEGFLPLAQKIGGAHFVFEVPFAASFNMIFGTRRLLRLDSSSANFLGIISHELIHNLLLQERSLQSIPGLTEFRIFVVVLNLTGLRHSFPADFIHEFSSQLLKADFLRQFGTGRELEGLKIAFARDVEAMAKSNYLGRDSHDVFGEIAVLEKVLTAKGIPWDGAKMFGVVFKILENKDDQFLDVREFLTLALERYLDLPRSQASPRNWLEKMSRRLRYYRQTIFTKEYPMLSAAEAEAIVARALVQRASQPSSETPPGFNPAANSLAYRIMRLFSRDENVNLIVGMSGLALEIPMLLWLGISRHAVSGLGAWIVMQVPFLTLAPALLAPLGFAVLLAVFVGIHILLERFDLDSAKRSGWGYVRRAGMQFLFLTPYLFLSVFAPSPFLVALASGTQFLWDFFNFSAPFLWFRWTPWRSQQDQRSHWDTWQKAELAKCQMRAIRPTDGDGRILAEALTDLEALAKEPQYAPYGRAVQAIRNYLGDPRNPAGMKASLVLFKPTKGLVSRFVNKFNFREVMLIDPVTRAIYIDEDFWQRALVDKGSLQVRSRNLRLGALLAQAAASLAFLQENSGAAFDRDRESLMKRAGDLFAIQSMGLVLNRAISEFILTTPQIGEEEWLIKGLASRGPPLTDIVLQRLEKWLVGFIWSVTPIRIWYQSMEDRANERIFNEINLGHADGRMADLIQRLAEPNRNSVQTRFALRETYRTLRLLLAAVSACVYLRTRTNGHLWGYSGERRKIIMEQLDVVGLSQIVTNLEDVLATREGAAFPDLFQLRARLQLYQPVFQRLHEYMRDKVEDTSYQTPYRWGIFKNHGNDEAVLPETRTPGLYEDLEADLRAGKNRTHFVWAMGGGADILSGLRRETELKEFAREIAGEQRALGLPCGQLSVVLLTVAEKRIGYVNPAQKYAAWQREQNPLYVVEAVQLGRENVPHPAADVLDMVQKQEQAHGVVFPKRFVRRQPGVIHIAELEGVEATRWEGIVKATTGSRVRGAARKLDEAFVLEGLAAHGDTSEIYLVGLDGTLGGTAETLLDFMQARVGGQQAKISLELYEHGGDAVALMHAGDKKNVVSPNNEKFAIKVAETMLRRRPDLGAYFTLSGLGNDFESYHKWINEVLRYLLKHDVIAEIVAPWAPGVLAGARRSLQVSSAVTSYANKRGLQQLTESTWQNRVYGWLSSLGPQSYGRARLEALAEVYFSGAASNTRRNVFKFFFGYSREGRVQRRGDLHGSLSFEQIGENRKLSYIMPFAAFVAASDQREAETLRYLGSGFTKYRPEEIQRVESQLAIHASSPEQTIHQIGNSFHLLGIITEEGNVSLAPFPETLEQAGTPNLAPQFLQLVARSTKGGALSLNLSRAMGSLAALVSSVLLSAWLFPGTAVQAFSLWGAGAGVLAWGLNYLPRAVYMLWLLRPGVPKLEAATLAASAGSWLDDLEARGNLPAGYRRPEVRLLEAQSLGSKLRNGWRLAYGEDGVVYLHPAFLALPEVFRQAILQHEIYEARGLGHLRATGAEYLMLAKAMQGLVQASLVKMIPSLAAAGKNKATRLEVTAVQAGEANRPLRGSRPALTRWFSQALGTLLHPEGIAAQAETGSRWSTAGTVASLKGLFLIVSSLAWLLVWSRPAAAPTSGTAEVSAAWFISQAEDTTVDVYTRFGAGDFLHPQVEVRSTAGLSWLQQWRYRLGGIRQGTEGPVLFVPEFLLQPKAGAWDEQLRQTLLRSTLEHLWRRSQAEGRLAPWQEAWSSPARGWARIWTRLQLGINPDAYLAHALAGDPSDLAKGMQQPGSGLHQIYLNWAAQPDLKNTLAWMQAALVWIKSKPERQRIEGLLTLQRLAETNPYLAGSSLGTWQSSISNHSKENSLVLPDLLRNHLDLERELVGILRSLPLALDPEWFKLRPKPWRLPEDAA
jgi:hypothetical protein